MREKKRTTAEAIECLANQLWSPNEADMNFEPANVVDGLYAIARGLHDVARAIREANELEPVN